VASRAGTAAIPGAADYVVAKTAVMRLSEETSPPRRGVRRGAFSLHPGGVASRPVQEAIDEGKVPPERFPDAPEAAARMVAELAEGHQRRAVGRLSRHPRRSRRAHRGVAERAVAVLRVVDLPAERHARPFTG